MVDSARIVGRSSQPEARREIGGELRLDALRARDGRPLLREILGPDGVVRTRLSREVVLGAIRASSGR